MIGRAIATSGIFNAIITKVLTNTSVKISETAVKHIVTRHWFNSTAKSTGKFLKNLTEKDLKKMIKKAVKKGLSRENTLGRAGTIIEHNFGTTIGTTSSGQVATSLYLLYKKNSYLCKLIFLK
jgi:hypothetical protein